MKITDFFFHPIAKVSEADLFQVDTKSLCDYLVDVDLSFDKLSISSGLLTVFSPHLIDWNKCAASDRVKFSVLLDFRNPNIFQKLDQYNQFGHKALVLHPYLQKITQSDWPRILCVAEYANKMGFFFIICTAYGSQDMYRYKVLPFVKEFAEGIDGSIVLAHCGGAKILEALLIADSHHNIFLETSFTLSYWNGSSIADDIAFAMKKLGSNRWLYGSDSPFIDFKKAIDDNINFLESRRFSDADIEQIMGKTACEYFEI